MRLIIVFTLCLFSNLLFAQPLNDDCAGLIDLGPAPFCPDNIFYTNENATASDIGNDNIPGTGSCNGNDITFTGNDVWFAFTSSDTIFDYTITVTGLSDAMGSTPLSNPQIMLYRGDCGFDDMALFSCATSNNGVTSLELDVLDLDPNTVYFIRINDWSAMASSNWGTFQLCVEEKQNALIALSNVDTICLGQSVQLTADGVEDFDIYSWTSDNDPNIPTATPNPTVFPFVSTTYEITAIIEGNNLILNGDFESGNTGFITDYVFGPDSLPIGQWGPLSFEGSYDITNSPNLSHSNFANCPDHTTGTGSMMVINGSSDPNANLWCQTVTVVPNTDYLFSSWVTAVVFENPPILQFSINGNLLDAPFNTPFGTCNWTSFDAAWNSGGSTTAEICIVNQNTLNSGNDFALDDISFRTFESSSDSVTVYVSNPTVSITEAIDASCSGICDGSATVSASGSISNVPYTYLWDNGAMTNSISNLCAGTFSVTITDGLGCTAETSIVIEETPFTVGAMSLIPPCEIITVGIAQAITNSGAPPYVYNWDNGETTETAVNLDEGIHEVTITDANGCSAITTVEIIFPELVNVQISTSADTICLGQSTILNTTTNIPVGTSLEWSTGQTTNSIEVSPDITTTYTLTTSTPGMNLITNGDFEAGDVAFQSDYVIGPGGQWGPLSIAGTYVIEDNTNDAHTNFNSCFDHTSGMGNMMVINGADSADENIWCQTVTVLADTDYQFATWVLSALAENPAILQFSINGVLLGNSFQAPQGFCEWQQFFEIWNSGSATTAEICIVNQNTLNSGNDFALDDISLVPICISQDERTIVVTTLETAITTQPNTDCMENVGSATIEIINGIAPFTYLWSNGEMSATASNLAPGSNQVTVTNDYGCSTTTEVFIEEAVFNIDSVLTTNMMCGEVGSDFIEVIGGSISLFTSNGSPPYSYSIDGGVNFLTENIFEDLENGSYSILVEDTNGCIDSTTIMIEDLLFPESPIINLSTDEFCENITEIELTLDNEASFDSLIWSTGAITSSISASESGTYSITVFNQSNCPANAAVTLTECGQYDIPNAFTPNGDNISDFFGIFSTGNVEILEMKIYNRWGTLVHDSPEDWDGQYNGKPHPADVLFYMIRLNTPQGEARESGDITLIR